jgi:hypothetical protein
MDLEVSKKWTKNHLLKKRLLVVVAKTAQTNDIIMFCLNSEQIAHPLRTQYFFFYLFHVPALDCNLPLFASWLLEDGIEASVWSLTKVPSV